MAFCHPLTFFGRRGLCDSRNLNTRTTCGNGVELTNQVGELGRMTDRQFTKGGNIIGGFACGYDKVGNKLYQEDQRDSQASELYGYDSRDRLTDRERGRNDRLWSDPFMKHGTAGKSEFHLLHILSHIISPDTILLKCEQLLDMMHK